MKYLFIAPLFGVGYSEEDKIDNLLAIVSGISLVSDPSGSGMRKQAA